MAAGKKSVVRGHLESTESRPSDAYSSEGPESSAAEETLPDDSSNFRSCDDSGKSPQLRDAVESEGEEEAGTGDESSEEADSQLSEQEVRMMPVAGAAAARQSEDDESEVEEDSRDIQIFKTARGRPMLYLDGFFYVLDKERNLKYYWECKRRRHVRSGGPQCPARLVTEMAANGTHTPTNNDAPVHSHEGDPTRTEVEILREHLKTDGKVNKGAKPSRIISDAGARVSSYVQGRISKNAQRQIIKRARATSTPQPEPKKLADIAIPVELRTTIDGDKFYHGFVETKRGGRAYLFTSVKELQRMNSARFWTADATFDVPPMIRQMFSIHCSVGPFHNSTIPSFYALMTTKSEECYRLVLEELIRIAAEYGISMKPKRIFTDFEKALQNAFDSVFPNADPTGCYFHWTQALRRKLDTLKIGKKVSKNAHLKAFFCKVKALAFVPYEDIPHAFQELNKTTPKILEPFMDYLATTYVLGKTIADNLGKPLFDPKIWSVYQNVLKSLPRNTNSHEGWHSRLIRLDAKKLKIYDLVRELRQEQKSSQGKVHEIISGRIGGRAPASVFQDNLLFKAVVTYQQYDDCLEYLEVVAGYLH